jgi:tetratricopeptide (TPR) repeat protein
MKRSVVGAVAASTLMLVSTLVWLDARQEREYRRLLALGDAAGATVEAIEAFSGALALEPRSVVARLKRGDVYRRRGEFASAVRDLRDVVVLDPASPRAHELLGDAGAAIGQDTAGDYARALALDDQAPRVAYKLGVAHYRAGRLDEAIATFRLSLTLDETLHEAHYLLGLSLRDAGSPAESEEAFLRAIQLEPSLSVAREELAALYTDTGFAGKAIEQLEALAALEPNRPDRLVRLGLAHAQRGRHDAAVLTLGRAAERHPGATVVYVALGRVWLQEAERHGSPVALGKALESLAPPAARAGATSDTLTLYGRALDLSGQHEEAERVLRLAVSRFPVSPIGFAHLADAARALGHLDLARESAARYVLLRHDERR